VRDSGMGIPAAMLPKVFDLFTQAERTYARAQGGLGIGLTLVRSLVELHGGCVEARSEGVGKGSEFLVRIPLVEQFAPVHHDNPISQQSVVPSHRILVVDDNHDAGDTIGMILEMLGAEVHIVRDGPAALSALNSYRPETVLLDIGLPGMDGYEVARRARQLPEGRELTLVAVTGWGQAEDRRRSKEAGMDHHLVKPVDIAALEKLLTTLAAKNDSGRSGVES
jgi:CheY-like chemotaxis protein